MGHVEVRGTPAKALGVDLRETCSTSSARTVELLGWSAKCLAVAFSLNQV